MKTLELILHYKNIIDTNSGLSLNPNNKMDANITINKLKEELANLNSFNSVMNLIFSLNNYPIYIHCAKLYPEYYYNYFKENDEGIYNTLLSYVCDKFIYLETCDIDKAITEPILEDIFISTDSMDTVYQNKILALKYYNNATFNSLVINATKYYNIYHSELKIINNISAEDLFDNFIKFFKAAKTYHTCHTLINKLYLNLTSQYSDKVNQIINTCINSTDKDIVFFAEEFHDLKSAYDYKNK